MWVQLPPPPPTHARQVADLQQIRAWRAVGDSTGFDWIGHQIVSILVSPSQPVRRRPRKLRAWTPNRPPHPAHTSPPRTGGLSAESSKASATPSAEKPPSADAGRSCGMKSCRFSVRAPHRPACRTATARSVRVRPGLDCRARRRRPCRSCAIATTGRRSAGRPA